MAKLEKFLLGTMLVGGLALGAPGCSSKNKESKDKEEPKTEKQAEIKVSDYVTVTEYNEALFESCRSNIKFALAFAENYYPYIYWCGEAWTAGHGLTILYNADGTYTKVTKDTKVPTLAESDVFKGRYLTQEILPDIKNCFKVPVDENTLIAACVLRYCIGGNAFRNSNFLKAVNAGEKGEELSKYLTGYRQQLGVLNRCYFFAALLANKITFDDLLDLRAEGCYNLETPEICKCKKNKDGSWKKIKVKIGGKTVKRYDFYTDKDNYCYWIFDDIDKKLEKAKQPRQVKLNLGNKKTANVDCQLVKDIVPDYVWQDVSKNNNNQQSNTVNFADVSPDMLNDSSYIAYQNGNYDKAVKFGKDALKIAETEKQKGAANYNIGVSYLKKCKYNKAVHYLEQSLAHNETPAGKDALKTAQEKQSNRNEKRGKTAKGILIGAGIAGAAIYGRKKYLAYNHRQR